MICVRAIYVYQSIPISSSFWKFYVYISQPLSQPFLRPVAWNSQSKGLIDRAFTVCICTENQVFYQVICVSSWQYCKTIIRTSYLPLSTHCHPAFHFTIFKTLPIIFLLSLHIAKPIQSAQYHCFPDVLNPFIISHLSGNVAHVLHHVLSIHSRLFTK